MVTEPDQSPTPPGQPTQGGFPMPPPVSVPDAPAVGEQFGPVSYQSTRDATPPVPPMPSPVPGPVPPLDYPTNVRPRHRAPIRPIPTAAPMPARPLDRSAYYAPRIDAAIGSSLAPPARGRGSDLLVRLRRNASRIAALNATRDAREYVDLQRQLTAAVTSGRRIAVVSMQPAQGASTVAALLGTALATRRPDPVLMVDAAAISSHPSLDRVFAAAPTRTIRDLAASPPTITSRSGFVGQLTPIGADMWLIPADQTAGVSGQGAPDRDTYAAAVDPFIRYFDITVSDLGWSPGAGTADLVLNRAHALCVVTSATHEGIDAATSLLRDLRDRMGSAWVARVVLLANQFTSNQRLHRGFVRERASGFRLVRLPYDPNLTPGFPERLSTLSASTHLAAMRTASEVLGTAIPSTELASV